MADRYLLESGAPDGYLLEDGSGVVLLDVAEVTLVIDDALHAHAADNLALVQDQFLVIQEALHAHVSGNQSGSTDPAKLGLTEGAYAAQVSADNPVLYWRLSETSGLPQDSSGNELDATTTTSTPVYSEPAVIREIFDKAITYDGTDAHQAAHTTPYGSINWEAEQDFTIELWFRGSTVAGGAIQAIIGKYNGWSALQGWRIGWDASDNLVVRLGTGTDYLSIAGAVYLDGKPHHLVVTRECVEPRLTMYIDNTQVATTTNAAIDDNYGNTQNFRAGGAGGSQGFIGTVDEIAIYRTVLSTGRITAHWDAGKPITLAVADALHAHAADTLQKNPARADDFDQSAGTWAGKTADLGGNWVEETAATGAADTVTGTVAQVVHSSPGDSSNSQNMRLDGALENIEAVCKVRVNKVPTGDTISCNIPVRKQTGLNELYRGAILFSPDGHLYHRLEAAAPGTVFGPTHDLGVYTANDWWWIKIQIRSDPSGGNFLFSKAWKDGTSEPAAWMTSENDDVATYMHGPGTVGLRTFTPTTCTNFPYTFQFDDFDVKVNQELSQVHILAIQDALHAHAADNMVLEEVAGSTNLVIQDALHGHTADNLALTQVHELVIQDALHAHAADNLALTQVHILIVQEALHGHAADNLVLTQGQVLVIQEALHGHAADNLVLVQVHVLQVQDALHGHAADNLTLTVPGPAPPASQGYYSLRRRRGVVGSRR